ncbi:hypothetical protein G6F46_010286 [Rhizopus delemar]|uniref:Uncharacterized protein n=3 Tax=Rhizopus TaxID=4842 RepID=I1C785_RHIO9|nr:hypothetical protein RO3G_09025 [Rhizopus delemar RA 99-880]KAG1051034.1 hypothetical protein G6F43_006738 [Rhizopus delemar]KAG1537473.1 hypothetical protein G6F51_010351 [Rhizopus arrhizus]KAG1451046.1 hypothetical protein G6F55_009379 [Rhizopus delemar]KAG1491664.1 hypothetical protein G6F54_009855 [Rhizopus delemar]|eukprot:EIE84315.1 hypothetical protein RO3G_09025 [Rhizopus delemar RA 99-880]
MSLIGSVSGFAAFGVLVRTYALGLQKRPVFSNPSSHALAAGIFGSVGYFMYELQERQAAGIAAKREIMIQNRKRAEELAASA